MILGDSAAHVELSIHGVDAPIPPHWAGGNVKLAVRVRRHAFAGAVHAYVVKDSWDAFLAALTALERERRGEAVLESVDPRELRLRFFASDHAGHMAVDGHVGAYDAGELSFEFPAIPFDPTLLPHLLKELTTPPSVPASD